MGFSFTGPPVLTPVGFPGVNLKGTEPRIGAEALGGVVGTLT